MGKRLLYLTMILFVTGFQQAGISADRAALPPSGTVAEAEQDKQLKINRDALLKGSVDAATVLLFNENAAARQILLEALKQSENGPARVAVCKALSQARAGAKAVANKEDFVQPLVQMLATEEDVARAKSAAEALLIFEFKYEQLLKLLDEAISEPAGSAKARLRAIYVLQLQPDLGAIFKLIELLDDADKQVAAEAETALHSLGLPVGADAAARKQIIDELRKKGKDGFLRDWVLRQEARIRELEEQLRFWKGRYSSALDQVYDGLREEAEKGKFLAGLLTSPKEDEKLWALQKVYQLRVSSSPKLPPGLGPILISLVVDPSREIRLRTAKLLSLMVELDSAEQLLKQLEVEQDEEVKMQLFVALGGACHYAFMPTTTTKLPDETRKTIRGRTLELAGAYVAEPDAKKALEGAKVMTKLLAQTVASSKVDTYLDKLAGRCKEEKGKADGTLRAELLSAMALLCAQGSACKVEATTLFGPLFEEALTDKVDPVREAAVDGLINIDRTRALNTFRKGGLTEDSNPGIRKKVIGVAGEVGSKEDLAWLAKKTGSTAENDLAWQALLKIFEGSSCDAAVLEQWMVEFSKPNPASSGLSDEQWISFLQTAERKALSENKPGMIAKVRTRLAERYRKTGNLEQAAAYLGLLREAASTDEEKEPILGALLSVYLNGGNIDAAVALVDNSLLEKDLGPKSAIVQAIEEYIGKPSAEAKPDTVRELLGRVKAAGNRPAWQEQVKLWTDRLGRSGGLGESNKPAA